ncbi:hypothetical protein F5Y15DRAFT_285717 [Xylariaceae sp. FL0016]|nr:hypothetical protein F5Y15DRAFT_285717 [Xylariaceae sp. FL0016]
MAQPDDIERQQVIDTVISVLTAISDRQPPFAEAHQYLLPDCTCVLSQPDWLVVSPLKDHVYSVETLIADALSDGTSSIEQTLCSPNPEVWVHDDLAAVWAGYNVSLDGREASKGNILFSLLKVDDAWKICGVADKQWIAGSAPPELCSDLDTDPDIMAPVNALLAAFSDPDWDAISRWFLEGGSSVQIRPPTPYQVITLEQSIARLQDIRERLAPGTTFSESLHDIQVRTCGNLGFIWAPFVIETGGKESHKGVNIFSLLKKDHWVISGCQNIGKPVN